MSAFTSTHHTDANGRPAGGTTFGRGFAIGWQAGPLVDGGERREPNGAFVEDIIAAARDRILFYEDAGFGCQENRSAIIYLAVALDVLNARTRRREASNVEGTHTAAPGDDAFYGAK